MSDAGKSILIVDDEKSICDILGQFLSRRGYKVLSANSAEQGVDFINSSPVDLVITDIKMPGMSGVELLKIIRQKEPQVPVLITTGFPTLDTAIEALKLGAFDYLTKPFHLEEIGEKIRRALNNKRLEQENFLFSKLVSLHEITKVLSSTLDTEDLNYKFLNYCVKITSADGGALMFVDANSKLNVMETSGTITDSQYWESRPVMVASRFVASREESLILTADTPEIPAGLLPLSNELQCHMLFPLRTATRTIGVLNLVRLKNNQTFTDVEIELINVLASQASISIENVKLYQNIRDNYLKTIRAFALAVEAKDEYTHGHSERVMKITVVIAKHMGLGDQEIELVKYAGLLHDIGKIGISELILNKAGKLTNSEFEEIKKHPELGARIIADVPFLKSLVPLVLHHHEFYAGGGYPTGIAGNEIPFGARILSVADAYEAMTSDRPYRKALPKDVAFGILIKEKGKQFDSQVVDAFLEVIHKEENLDL